MKKNFILFFFFYSYLAQSQTAISIDSSNYYDFLDTHQSIYWMNREDVTEVILSELRSNGYNKNSTYVLMKVDSLNYLVLSVYCHDLNAGFLYPEVHEYPPKKKHRMLRSSDKEFTGYDYIQKVEKYPNSSYFIKIKDLPNNIIILNEDCYWYQPTNNNPQSVSKSVITKILREDIKTRLRQFEIIYNKTKR